MRRNIIIGIGILFILIIPLANAALSDNIVSYWKMDGNATDSLKVNNMTLRNSPTNDASYGKINKGYRLIDSSSQALEMLSSPNSFLTSNTGTFTMWTYGNALVDSTRYTLFSMSKSSTGATDVFRLEWDRSKVSGQYYDLSVNLKSAGVNRISVGLTNGSMALNNNAWNFIAISSNGTKVKIYINGALKQTLSNTYWWNDMSGIDNLCFGTQRFNGGIYYFYHKGYIDESGIWTRALSDSEITSLYASGSPTSSQQYPFSSGSNTCTYLGSGDWIISNNCHLTSIDIPESASILVKENSTIWIDNGVTIK
jgi:hypothetical protein